MNSPLNNELLVADTGLENSVENSATADSDDIPRGNPYHNYTVGEDGNWYNDNGERVYYWVRPFEGDEEYMNGETQGVGQDLGGYYTEEEIRAAYTEGSVLAEQTGGWDNYWAFIQERQQEIQNGNLIDPIQANYDQAARDYASENTDPDAPIANTGRDEEIYYAQSDANKQRSLQDQMNGWVEQNTALMNKYGITGVYQNDNGDVYAFNGSTYSRTYLAPGKDWGEIVAGVMLGAFTGNIVGGLVNAAGGAIYGAGWGGPIVDIINGVATGTGAGAGYEIPDMNPNVIVNIAGATPPATPPATNQTPINPVDEVTPTSPEDLLRILRDLYPDLFKGGGGTGGGGNPGKYYPGTEFSEDLWDLYDYQNLPEGYVLSGDGKYVTGPDGERYPVYYGMYGARVFLPKDINEEGGGGGSSGGGGGDTTDATTMSQEEADAAIQQMIESGLYGQELSDAMMDAGITPDQVSDAIQRGIITGRDLSNDPDKYDRMNNENAPNLVIYDGKPELLDPDGVWEPAGQGWDGDSLDENGKPRKYYVWKHKETGETWIMYEDELGEYEGAYDFEAYIEEQIPDLTDEERKLIGKLVELGQPIGEILRDIIASREDLNKEKENETNPTEITTTLPNGTEITIPNPNYDPNAPPTTNNQVGQPCNIGGKYDGVIVEAPSGALVCSIDFDTNFPEPKDGDKCEMPDGSAGTYKDGVCVANDPSTTPTIPGTGTNPNPNDPQPGDACTIGGKEGVLDDNLVCQVSEDPNPTGPQPGDSCTTADGQPGTVDANGVCQVNQNPDLSGKPCTMPDGSAGTTDANGVCQVNNSPTNPGGQACTMPDGSAGTTDANGVCQPNNPGTKPGDACTTADGQQGTIGQDGVTCETGPGGSGKPCILPDGSVGVTDENGVCKGLGTGPGPGNGPGDGPGDGNGNGPGGGMLSGGGSSVTKNGPLFPYHQFKKFQYTPPPEPTLGMRLFDELFKG